MKNLLAQATFFSGLILLGFVFERFDRLLTRPFAAATNTAEFENILFLQTIYS